MACELFRVGALVALCKDSKEWPLDLVFCRKDCFLAPWQKKVRILG